MRAMDADNAGATQYKDKIVYCGQCGYAEKYIDGLILCRRTKTSFRVSENATCKKGKEETAWANSKKMKKWG